MKKFRNIAIIVFMLVALAFASTQGPNSAATITGTGWTSPTSAATTDATYATINIASIGCSSNLTFSAYGFSIPAGATINGITVAVVGHASRTTALDMSNANLCGSGVQLTKVAGTGVGTVDNTETTSWAITDSTFTLGSGASLWGTTWTPTEINASGFGVLVSIENKNASATTAFVDSVLITVTYTPGGCPSCFMPFLESQIRRVKLNANN